MIPRAIVYDKLIDWTKFLEPELTDYEISLNLAVQKQDYDHLEVVWQDRTNERYVTRAKLARD